MDTTLEWKIVICQIFNSGQRTVGREEEDRKNKVTDFMRSRNMEEDLHLWRLEVMGGS